MSTGRCDCGAHSQHLVFRYQICHPSVPLKAVAKAIGISYAAVRLAASRSRRRADLSRRCPECFRPTLRDLVCTSCGVELDRPNLPLAAHFDEQSPVHTIHPGNGLGSEIVPKSDRFGRLSLAYGGQNISHLVHNVEDPLMERAKSRLWEVLKGPMLQDGVVEEATRLLMKDIVEFEHIYPDLVRGHRVADQLVSNSVRRLVLRYPRLKRCVAVSGVGRRLVEEKG